MAWRGRMHQPRRGHDHHGAWLYQVRQQYFVASPQNTRRIAGSGGAMEGMVQRGCCCRLVSSHCCLLRCRRALAAAWSPSARLPSNGVPAGPKREQVGMGVSKHDKLATACREIMSSESQQTGTEAHSASLEWFHGFIIPFVRRSLQASGFGNSHHGCPGRVGGGGGGGEGGGGGAWCVRGGGGSGRDIAIDLTGSHFRQPYWASAGDNVGARSHVTVHPWRSGWGGCTVYRIGWWLHMFVPSVRRCVVAYTLSSL